MKAYITMKKLVAEVPHIFSCGYCDLSALGFKPQYYNSGVYGWNCDIILNDEQNIAITTGYRNTRGERLPSSIIGYYTRRAKDLYNQFHEFCGKPPISIHDYDEALTLLRRSFWKTIDGFVRTGKIELY